MKAFYRKKGKWKDGRDRIVIEDRANNKCVSLPKPEELLDMLAGHQASINIGDGKYPTKVSKNPEEKSAENNQNFKVSKE